MTNLAPFYVGQVPLESLKVTIEDQNGSAVDITPYTAATLLIFDGQGNQVDTSAGTVTQNSDRGVLVYDWPSTSLFTTVGTYSYQFGLSAPGAQDYTSTGEFVVLPLGGK